jgi:hypothetical protein
LRNTEKLFVFAFARWALGNAGKAREMTGGSYSKMLENLVK